MPNSIRKKHLDAFMAAMHESKPRNGDLIARVQWAADCMAVAGVCERFNATFDRLRFLSGCEGGSL